MLKDLGFVRAHYTPSRQKKPIHRFLCECGNEFETCIYDVRNGATRSCGCLATKIRQQVNTKHGAAKSGAFSLEYRSYRNMLTRARNPNTSTAHLYVGRGIGVADEWLPGGDGEGFKRFLAHVGPRPSQEYSLDRIDVNKGYEPGNVRWATQRQQALNTRANVLVTYQGVEMPLVEAAELSGIPYGVLRDRMGKLNWPEERWFEPRARAAFGTSKLSRKGVQQRGRSW